MLNVNKVILGGTVYNVKESTTKNGKQVARFTITTWSRKGEGKDDVAIFHECCCYGAKAAVILKYVKNKDLIFLEGEINQFENKEGKRVSNVIVHEFNFVEKKSA